MPKKSSQIVSLADQDDLLMTGRGREVSAQEPAIEPAIETPSPPAVEEKAKGFNPLPLDFE